MGWLAAGVLYSLTYLLVGWWLREQLVALVYLRAAALLVPPLLAVLVIVRRRHLWAGCQWLFWATVVLGLMISAIGLVGWTIDAIQLARGTSWLGWYAVFLLFGGAAPLFALLAQPHRGRRERAAATTAVDIAGLAVLSGFLYSHVVTATWVTPARGDDLDLTLLLLSELQQFLVLAGMTAAALLARRQGWGATYRRLAWGMLVHFAALSLTNAEVWQWGYWSGSVYDCALILPYFFYPWAVQVAPSSGDSPSEADEPVPTTRPWLIFGVLALIPLIDYGLASALPREALSLLGGFRELSLAVTVVSVLPLLMARLAVERAEVKESGAELRLFAAALEQADDMIFIATRDGRLHHTNAAFRRALGYSSHELTGCQPEDLVMEQSRWPGSPIEDALRTQGVWRGIIQRRRKDGSSFAAWSTIVPLVDSRGHATHLAGVERDMSEDERLRDQLIQSERRYRLLVDQAPIGIYRATVEGRLLMVNRALVEILGYDSAEELAGVNITSRYQEPSQCRRVFEELRRRVARGSMDLFETRWQRKDGREMTVRLSGRLILDEQSSEDTVEIFVEDVTERHRLEAEFRQAQKMEAVGLLAGGVAHDFNNQLTAIYGYTEAVLSQLTEEKPLWADLQQIRHAALRASSLTQQLLAFGRRQLLQIEAVDLNAVLSNVEPMLRRLISEDIRIEIRLSPQLDRIKADPTQLEHVIMNLAVNARDAMPHGGTLALETANDELDGHHRPRSAADLKPGRYARLTVRDDGCGMDAATRARLFEPFFTTKEKGKGTGLGLATAYGIVKQLGGEICVESAPNQGSTFTLYFLATTEALPVKTERTGPAIASVGTETILLVEDEPFVRDFAATVLRRHGFHVLEACAPEEALALAARTPVLDLVLTDVVMPGMSGPQMLDRLRAQRPVRALLMSGYPDREIVPRGLPGQEIDLLHKPFGLHDLLRKVRAALDAEPLDAPPPQYPRNKTAV